MGKECIGACHTQMEEKALFPVHCERRPPLHPSASENKHDQRSASGREMGMGGRREGWGQMGEGGEESSTSSTARMPAGDVDGGDGAARSTVVAGAQRQVRNGRE